MSQPIRYARSDDVNIAYQVVGEGPTDPVFVAGAITNLEVLWEDPDYRRFCERLGAFVRLLLFDKRGMGLSDRVRMGTLEQRMDDVRAVMDAAGSERLPVRTRCSSRRRSAISCPARESPSRTEGNTI